MTSDMEALTKYINEQAQASSSIYPNQNMAGQYFRPENNQSMQNMFSQMPQQQQNQAMPNMFAENNQNGMSMPNLGGFLKLNNANLLVIALGVIMASTIGGILSSMFSSVGALASFSTIIAGLLLMYFGKSKPMMKDFGAGVLIGGLAVRFAGLGASLGGALQGVTGGMSMMPPGTNPGQQFQELKYTYGGSDGVQPTTPDRRVFS